ncbi:uncharacterized protein CTRU02_213756 [Colletotrichum truncatum]|uniref:Uncharacterized protein n=1 Tax=Colletotrichum truncatum TaxID=5467 RepID=A0ACC3YGR4_COLTU|nr:uncharacterized protein CTRU02_14680 [Colletotrichum truncatum]KAF6781896.1 hypothetical protein CTRU02_14680 [Colletotrichum truncatum]
MAVLTSSLSELSAISSPDSFRTAIQSPEGAEAMGVKNVPATTYSLASQLPRELKAHCQIYLEEHLYNGALGLLNSLLIAGYTRKGIAKKPVYVPPATHLALLNTLAIHPSHTTRAAGPDRLEVGSQTLDYLRNLLAIVGPINAGFKDAFQFQGVSYGRRHRHHDEEDDEIDGDQVSNKMAVEDSIWHRAHDFWAVVGWAFNCSSIHPRRWRYWKTWLEFMVDVLEADLQERKRMDEESTSPSQESTWAHMRGTILVMYIKQKADSNRYGLKMIQQALFAEGNSSAVAKFPEIFNKETKGLPSEDKTRKRMATLDIENDQFGDYFNDDLVDSEPSQPGTPTTPATPRTPAGATGDLVAPEVAESIPIRLRLMDLLSIVAGYLPGDFMTYAEYASDLSRTLNQQPLSFFRQFISDMRVHVNRVFELELLATELDLLLPSSYKDPGDVVSTDSGIIINAEVLKLCYLPHHANTVDIEDNARLALILESLLYHLTPDEVRATKDDLRAAAAKGIEARKTKAKVSKRKETRSSSRRGQKQKELGDRERYAAEMMELAGERILSYIDIMGAIVEESDEDHDMTD